MPAAVSGRESGQTMPAAVSGSESGQTMPAAVSGRESGQTMPAYLTAISACWPHVLVPRLKSFNPELLTSERELPV